MSDTLRKLWDHKSVPEVAEACAAINFESKSMSVIDPIIKSISTKRDKGKNLEEFIDKKDYVDYGLTLLRYLVPWLALFVISLIAL